MSRIWFAGHDRHREDRRRLQQKPPGRVSPPSPRAAARPPEAALRHAARRPEGRPANPKDTLKEEV